MLHGILKHADMASRSHAELPFAPCKEKDYLCNGIRISHLARYSVFCTNAGAGSHAQEQASWAPARGTHSPL
jgi:hypothetical protein